MVRAWRWNLARRDEIHEWRTQGRGVPSRPRCRDPRTSSCAVRRGSPATSGARPPAAERRSEQAQNTMRQFGDGLRDGSLRWPVAAWTITLLIVLVREPPPRPAPHRGRRRLPCIRPRSVRADPQLPVGLARRGPGVRVTRPHRARVPRRSRFRLPRRDGHVATGPDPRVARGRPHRGLSSAAPDPVTPGPSGRTRRVRRDPARLRRHRRRPLGRDRDLRRHAMDLRAPRPCRRLGAVHRRPSRERPSAGRSIESCRSGCSSRSLPPSTPRWCRSP